MSHLSRIFESAPVKVQNKNGFDLSHLNCGTAKTGQLVPVLCKLLPPNSDFRLGINMNVELPPLSTSFYGRVDAVVEGFIVPCSVLYGGWKRFITNNPSTSQIATIPEEVVKLGVHLPYILFPASSGLADFEPLYASNDNIAEFLGFRDSGSQVARREISLLPFMAYHLIWDVFYRNKQVTKTIFSKAFGANIPSIKNVSSLPSVMYFGRGDVISSTVGPTSSPFFGALFSTGGSLRFPDNVSIFSTRQRNYARDYFTAASLSPQQGDASRLSFDISVADENGEFTIGALRAANSLQKFLETNNLSQDYSDMMRNRWGVRPKDADFEEPYYLGRVVLPVYQKSVYQQNDSSTTGTSSNPFVNAGHLAAKGSNGVFVGNGSITDSFHNTTWSYVMCLFSLVPHAMYGDGLNRELSFVRLGDFPAPELQTVGNEEIMSSEVFASSSVPGAPLSTFGYIPRYSRFKYMDDEVHGELRNSRTLGSFVLQRDLSHLSQPVKLTTAFLEIPQDALDKVFAVSTKSMNLSCWYEIFFEFKVSMPLADFCIPTLGDIGDTHTISSPVGGSRL